MTISRRKKVQIFLNEQRWRSAMLQQQRIYVLREFHESFHR